MNNKENIMPDAESPLIRGLEIFRAGDYERLGKKSLTPEDNRRIVEDFRRQRAENGKTIPIIRSLSENDPHNKDGADVIGELTDLYLNTDGFLISGDGKCNDGYGDAFKDYPEKSAGFVPDAENPGYFKIDHVAVTFGDRAVIPNLKPNGESLAYAKSKGKESYNIPTDVTYISFSKSDNDKEVVENMADNKKTDEKDKAPGAVEDSKKSTTDELTFTKTQVETKVNEAVEAERLNFANQLKAKDEEIKTLKSKAVLDQGVIDQGVRTIEKLKSNLAEYSKDEKEIFMNGVRADLDGISSLTPDERASNLEMYGTLYDGGNLDLVTKNIASLKKVSGTDSSEYAKNKTDETGSKLNVNGTYTLVYNEKGEASFREVK